MRNTVQVQAIKNELHRLEHATNTELWEAVRHHLPDIALPSVHRITARLVKHGEIGGSLYVNGQTVLDRDPQPHSHFVCNDCQTIKNIAVDEDCIENMQNQIGGAIIPSSLVVQGSCLQCQS